MFGKKNVNAFQHGHGRNAVSMMVCIARESNAVSFG